MSQRKRIASAIGLAAGVIAGVFALNTWMVPATDSTVTALTVATPDMVAMDRSLRHWKTVTTPPDPKERQYALRPAASQQRAIAARALTRTVARMPAADIGAVRRAYRRARGTRDKLLIIGGLGQNAAPEAVTLLEEIYERADDHSVRSGVLRALGRSSAAGRQALLIAEMSSGDSRLQLLAIQGLYGDAASIDALKAVACGDRPVEIRLEAIRSLSAVHAPEARDALEALTGSTETALVRMTARKALRR